MNVSHSELSPLVWLTATQFLLYGLGWGVCSLILREQREAVVHWAVFMLLLGAGMLLTVFRGEPRAWWAYGGANTVLFTGFVLLRRGGEVFMGVQGHDREHLLLLIGVGATYLALGPGEANASWRVLLAYGGPAWVLLRTLVVLRRPMVGEFGLAVSLVLMTPLVVVAGTFGVRAVQQALDMSQSLEMHRVTDANRSLLFGYVVAAAMYNFTFVAMLTLRLLERLRALSQRDPLTGLLNRRALDEELAREWSRMKRGGPAFAVLTLDIDHFKQVNDRHGHLAGDALLEQLARRLHQTARQTDIVARVGGEEFVVIAPNATAEGAQAAASRLIHAVRQGRFDLPAGPASATVSVGVALSRAADASVQDVFKRADDALYQAKALGRDRVCIDPHDAMAPAPAAAPLRATA